MPQIRDNNRHATCRQMICRGAWHSSDGAGVALWNSKEIGTCIWKIRRDSPQRLLQGCTSSDEKWE